jgi:hypothetical protein
LLAVLQKEVEMLGSFSRFIKLDYVWTFEFQEYLDLSSYHLFVFDTLERNGLNCQQLILIIFDIATIYCAKASFAQLNRGNHISLNDFAGHYSRLNVDQINYKQSITPMLKISKLLINFISSNKQ